jgi:hypothetical protein
MEEGGIQPSLSLTLAHICREHEEKDPTCILVKQSGQFRNKNIVKLKKHQYVVKGHSIPAEGGRPHKAGLVDESFQHLTHNV